MPIRKKDSEFLFLEKLPLFLLYVVPIFIFMYGITDPANFFIVDQRILGQILNAVLMKSLSENTIGYGIVGGRHLHYYITGLLMQF